MHHEAQPQIPELLRAIVSFWIRLSFSNTQSNVCKLNVIWLVSQVCDIPVSRPGLETGEVGLWGLRPHLWYDPAAVAGAWGSLLQGAEALGGEATYLYDLADVGRQVMRPSRALAWTCAAHLGLAG